MASGKGCQHISLRLSRFILCNCFYALHVCFVGFTGAEHLVSDRIEIVLSKETHYLIQIELCLHERISLFSV